MEMSPDWEFVADTVMGGVSTGQLETVRIAGREAKRLTGDVSLENNGGFVQMAADLAAPGAVFDASGFDGLILTLRGNGASYDVRLRTSDLGRPWQSYRTSFVAPDEWTEMRFEFSDFKPNKTDAAFDPARLTRIGILAVGEEMRADIAVAGLRFYPES